MKVKKIFVVVLAVVMTFGMMEVFSSCNLSKKDETTEYLDFYPLPDGTYAVAVGRAKYLEEIVIPDEYNGKKVVEIPDLGFSSDRLISITIPDSVTSIGKSAFAYTTELTTINYTGTEEQWNAIDKGRYCIPDGVTIVYNYGK